MVMTGFGVSDRRRLVKGSSSSKGRTFDQEGSVMDPIDAESLSSAPPTMLVPYGMFEEDAFAPITSKKQPPSPIKESPSDQGLNFERNLVRTPTETSVSDTNPKDTKEDEPHSYQFVRRNSAVEILKSESKGRRQLIDESLNSDWKAPEKKNLASSSESLSPLVSMRNSSHLSSQ